MSYLLLGDTIFSTSSVISLSYSFNQKFAEQPKIESPPTLQLVGRELATCKLSLRFIFLSSNPDVAIASLLKSCMDAKPLALVDGSSNYSAKYVIESVDVSPRKTDEKGNNISVDANLMLKEWRTAVIVPPTKINLSPFKKIS